MNISAEEYFYLVLIGLITFLVLFRNVTDRNYYSIWAPTSIVSFIIIYYGVIGPLVAIDSGDTYYRLLDHRPYMLKAWRLVFVGLLSYMFGYSFIPELRPREKEWHPDFQKSDFEKKFGNYLLYISLILLVVLFGFTGFQRQLSLWQTQYARALYEGAFANYLLHSMNFLIGASCLLLISTIKGRYNKILFVAVILVSSFIFIKQGFRWRLVVLGLSLLSSYFLYKKTKPNLVFLVVVFLIATLIMGAIGDARIYGSGLQREVIEQGSGEDFFMSGFSESYTFLTTGLLIENVPEVFDYIYFDPLVQSIVMPIPRVFWPTKPSGEYINILNMLYGSMEHGQGAAVMNFGEYYMAFGYWGVILFSILLGYFSKRFWNWFIKNREDEVAIVLYAVGVSFLYMVFSRGYLPQVVMLFFFVVGPLIIVYYNHQRKIEQIKKSSFKKRDES